MHRILAAIILILAAVPGTSYALTLAKGSSAGTVTRLRGDATADLNGETRNLAANAIIEMGDRLHTGPGARLEVTFVDGTVLTLGERADFTIDALSVGPTSGMELFTRTAGAIRLVGGDIAKLPQHKIEVASNVGTIGIRGTDVWGGTIKPGSLLDVFLIEGKVVVRNRAGTVVLDKPGLGTSITTAGGKPQAPTQWQPALRDQAFATVSFDVP